MPENLSLAQKIKAEIEDVYNVRVVADEIKDRSDVGATRNRGWSAKAYNTDGSIIRKEQEAFLVDAISKLFIFIAGQQVLTEFMGG